MESKKVYLDTNIVADIIDISRNSHKMFFISLDRIK